MKDSKRGLTRRQLAATALALAPVAAQDNPKPAEDVAVARKDMQRTSSALRKFKLPMLVEPSFIFRP